MNLVSNDVRRFDEAMPFWVFLWAGPLELAIVVLMISLELGAAAAFAGIAALLALIPLQVGIASFLVLCAPLLNSLPQGCPADSLCLSSSGSAFTDEIRSPGPCCRGG